MGDDAPNWVSLNDAVPGVSEIMASKTIISFLVDLGLALVDYGHANNSGSFRFKRKR